MEKTKRHFETAAREKPAHDRGIPVYSSAGINTAHRPKYGSEKAQALKLNWGLRIFFSEVVRVSLRRPSQAAFFARIVLRQAGAARRRAREAREGLTVPPIVIFSITNRCNLR